MDLSPEIKRLFQEALDVPRGERQQWLQDHVRDSGTRDLLVELLEEHDASEDESVADAMKPLEALIASSQLSPGQVIGDYEIIRELGRGGMGVVYLAREHSLDRLVALKVLAGRLESLAAGADRLQREARALARLDHPAIVPVYRAGDVEGRPFLVMQYVEGENFSAVLARERAEGPTSGGGRNGRRLRRERQLRHAETIATLAEALDHAHRHKVVHRDVKPDNVIMDTSRRPHLTDFGIARFLDATNVTRAGHLAGSCKYMSPEQAQALSPEIDARSDVFSLGVVLYEALCGRVPFDGSSIAQVLAAVINSQPRRLRSMDPEMPLDLETICHKAIEKRPVDRYQTAAHMAADLRTFLAGGPILARPPSLARRGRRWLVRHRIGAMAGVLGVSLLVSSALLTLRWRSAALARYRVLVTVDRGSAVVSTQRLDAASLAFGTWMESGQAPMTLELAPGFYRVVAVASDGSFADTHLLLPLPGEHDRPPGERDPLELVLKLSSDAAEGMVLIDTAVHELGRADLDDNLTHRRLRRVALPAFYIDRSEVSNAEYAEFMRQMERVPGSNARPVSWPDGYTPPANNLPVVGVSYDQAEAYARWRGVRLPTAEEWEAAARWPDGRLRPWNDGAELQELPVERGLPADNPADLWTQYERSTRPIDSSPSLDTPSGLHHMLTNVAEHTATFVPDIQVTVVKGCDYRAGAERRDSTWLTTQPLGTGSPFTGFRCARSAVAPLQRRN